MDKINKRMQHRNIEEGAEALSVQDEEPVLEENKTYGGSFWNPTAWNEDIGEIVAGISPDENADGWFIYADIKHRCIKDGAPTMFYDTEYWSWREE